MYEVMIVDDEKAIRDNISSAIPFNDCGFNLCGTAKNGKDALMKLYELKPDLIMLDVNMPIMDGISFLDYLRKGEHKDTKVIMLSGYNNFEYAQKAIRYDVKAYLSKPIDEEEAIVLLNEIGNELKSEISIRDAWTIKQDVKLLNKIYNGRYSKCEELCKYYLLQVVIQKADAMITEKDFQEILNSYFSKILGENKYTLIENKGYILKYLINKDSLKKFDINDSKCGHKIICRLNEAGIEASVLIDDDIFMGSYQSFREEHAKRLQYLLTQIFYTKNKYVKYSADSKEIINGKIETKKAFLDSFKRNLLELDFKKIKSDFETIADEILEKQIGCSYIHEINYRIYYLIIDVLTTLNIKNEHSKNFLAPEWRNTLFLFKYENWKEYQLKQLDKIFKIVEGQRKVNSKSLYQEIINYLHCHYKEYITIKNLAEKFYLNATYVGRAFRKAKGVTIKQYLNDLRINEAKRILLNTDKMIYEIANEVGFGESKYFISKFIASEGLSPAQYRKGKLSN